MHVINLIKDAEICKLGEILTVLLKSEVDFRLITSMCVNNKTSSFLICSAHLHAIRLAETKYSCTRDDIHFPKLGKSYCMSRIRHYFQNMCSIFPSVVFNDE